MVSREAQEVLIPVARWKDSTPTGQITGTVKVHPDMSYPGLLPRTVHVWLPPGYEEETGQRYPVLYMHDGQQVFDPETSTHGIDWQVDETATRLIEEGKMRKILVVAVNCTSNRFRDYSETPEGAAYQAFMASHLKPFIDRTYRTLADRAHTAVMGASMGGRISFLLAWNHPETFSMAGCLSPSFDEDLTVRVAGESGPAPALFLYLDNGGVGLEKKLQAGCDQMLAALEQRGFVRDGNLVWVKDEEAEHNEAAWARRVHVPLLLMFGTGPEAWRPGSIPDAPQ